jgi:acyl-coenzyme A synthetase/AMP-(fatty) acid ligase
MTGDSLPLLDRSPDSIIAVHGGRAIAAVQFVAEVRALAARLPAADSVINLCDNRYRFLVGFAAALARGLTTLLPPNALDATVVALAAEWPRHTVLVDDAVRAVGGAPAMPARAGSAEWQPHIPADLLAAVAYTSGSTGASLPQRKSWRA